MTLKELLQTIIDKLNVVFISNASLDCIGNTLGVTYVDVVFTEGYQGTEHKWCHLPSNMTWGQLVAGQLKDKNGVFPNLVIGSDAIYIQQPGTLVRSKLCRGSEQTRLQLEESMKFADYPNANLWIPPI